MDGINMVDFAVLGLIFVSAFIGIARGFTREILGIAAWIGAFIIAIYGLILVRPLLTPYIKSALVADVVAGLVLFVIALFILGSVSRSLSGRVKGSVLGGLDRSLGFLFGIARGGAIIVVAYLISTLVTDIKKWPEEIKASKSYPYVLDGATWLQNAVPADAIKNLGLLKTPAEEEEVKTEPSTEHVVTALSQPKPTGFTTDDPKKSEDKKKEGYADTQTGDMERLVKNNE